MHFLTPQEFRSFPAPTYPKLQLAIPDRGEIAQGIRAAAPDAIHIATKVLIGQVVRAHCRQHGASAKAALALYHKLAAGVLIVEVNEGGEVVAAVLKKIDASVPFTPMRTTGGKYLRAKPVSPLYAQGRVRHVGALPALEDELCDFGPVGLSTSASPNRLHALVQALTHLLLIPKPEPRVRVL